MFLAGEPDKVDALCGAKVRNRTVDLVVVVFRRDRTIRYVFRGVANETVRGKELNYWNIKESTGHDTTC